MCPFYEKNVFNVTTQNNLFYISYINAYIFFNQITSLQQSTMEAKVLFVFTVFEILFFGNNNLSSVFIHYYIFFTIYSILRILYIALLYILY